MTTMNAAVNDRSENLWAYLAKLLRLRRVTFISGFKRARPLMKALDVGLVLLIAGVAVGCYMLSNAILQELDTPIILQSGINPAGLMDAVPSFIIAAIFILSLIASFRVLLQALYLARDMDFLVSAPIPIRAVFVSKLLEAILPNFILVMVFGLPVLLSIGIARGYHVAYYLFLMVVLVFLSLAAAGISSLLVMLVVHIFPAKRIAEVLTFLGAFLIILISQSFNLMGDKLKSLSPDQIATSADIFTNFNQQWIPLAWGGRALVDLGQGSWLSGGIFLALVLVSSAIIFWIALGTAEKLYYSGWSSLQVGTVRKKNHRTVVRQELIGGNTLRIGHWLPSQVRAILAKDFKQIQRDLNNLSQVIGAMIMGVVFGVMLLRSGGRLAVGNGEAPVQFMAILRSGMVYGSMVIGLFVGWAMLSRLALVAFSMEGRGYWILKTAPVKAEKLLAAKFLMAYLPSLILGWFYLIVIAILQKPPLATILYGLPSIALILAGLCGINLAIGVRSVNLTWTDPRKMENGVGGVFGLILSILYQLVTLVLFFGPPLGFPLLHISEKLGMLAGLLIGGSVTLICTFLPLKMIKNRVSYIGEE